MITQIDNTVRKNVPLILFGIYVFVVCGVSPYSRSVWWAENIPIILLVLALVVIYRFYRFTPTSYALMFCLIILHTIGGYFTFERVPFGFVTDMFGYSRNNYDRMAHFSVGFYAYPIAELLLFKRLVSSRWILFLFPIFTILAVAGAYEIFEWQYAMCAESSAGTAVLGSQGDVWDAQKDMFADGLGAILSTVAFCFIYRRQMGELKKALHHISPLESKPKSSLTPFLGHLYESTFFDSPGTCYGAAIGRPLPVAHFFSSAPNCHSNRSRFHHSPLSRLLQSLTIPQYFLGCVLVTGSPQVGSFGR